jgi:dihydrofolate synthase/folylpolyglutamate synthase
MWRVPYPKFGAGPGLVRVFRVARRLGVDLGEFGSGSVVVVGSNGKGSTAAMCAALLQQTGAPTGLFTSPHLLRPNERFRIDGADIEDNELEHHWRRVEEAVHAAGVERTLGGFEFLFLIAADWFAARGCRHTVWEAGIGGRLDPVRVIKARRVGLTALDWEHTELLGATLTEIACDKAEAAPVGGKLFVGEIEGDVLSAVDAHCRKRAVSVMRLPPLADCDPPLAGVFQRSNAALAVALAADAAPLSRAQVQAGLAATRWPGRLEIVSADPFTIIDVGHTPRAVAAALAGFEVMRGERPAVLVCGASADKDVAAIIGVLARRFETIICAAAFHKGAPAAEVAAIAAGVNLGAEVVVAEDIVDARRIAESKARDRVGAIYVAGGLFLAAEYKATLSGLDPGHLAFF